MIAILVVATQLRGVFRAVWLGSATSSGLGLRALVHVLTQALTVKLGFLVLAAVVLWLVAGRKRNLGRAFDLACVAALPLVFVDLAATVVVRAGSLTVPSELGVVLAALSFAWSGSLVALAWRPARIAPTTVPPPPDRTITPARGVGWGVLGLALAGTIVGALWVQRNLEDLRPMTSGDPAPMFALPAIGPHGVLGAPTGLAATKGKVTVLDFWATWCGPCLQAMPRLDAIARAHPDIVVLAINIDDPVAARALFDERGYQLTLLADDGSVSERYGVTTIPHTVVIDRAGVVRTVARGGGANLEATIEEIRK